MVQQKISRKLAQVKKGTLHVGVDLGLENNAVFVINEGAERLDRFRFPNDRGGYEYFHRRIKKHQQQSKAPEVLVAMEPTNYLWKLLACELEHKRIGYRLVNAYTVKKHREGDQLDRSKDDPRDAFTIADLSRTGKCTETQLQHDAYAELRQYISLYYRLKRQIRREKQHIWHATGQLFPELTRIFKNITGETAKAMLISQAAAVEIRKISQEEFIAKVRGGYDGTRLYVSRLRAAHRLAMSSVGVKYGVQALQLALKLHVESLNRLQDQEKQILSALEVCFLSLPEANSLMSVKGIGILSGATILAEIGDPKRFRHVGSTGQIGWHSAHSQQIRKKAKECHSDVSPRPTSPSICSLLHRLTLAPGRSTLFYPLSTSPGPREKSADQNAGCGRFDEQASPYLMGLDETAIPI
jgi:transposase